MNFSIRTPAILSIVLLSLFATTLLPPLAPLENFAFVQTAVARSDRARRAQNLSKKNRKIPENRDKREARKKAKDPIQDAQKNEKQRRNDWEAGQEARLRQKLKDKELQKEREDTQWRAEEAKEKRRKGELAAKKPEGEKELARMAIKIDEWKKFRKEMLRAANEKDVSGDYIQKVVLIDTQWVSQFNEYIEIYNAALSEPGNLFETGNMTKIHLLEKAMEQIEWQFYGTLKTYDSPEPLYVPTPLYVPVPVLLPPQPSPEDHQKMCDRKTAEMAISGAWGSSGANWELVELGCVSKERYCQSFSDWHCK